MITRDFKHQSYARGLTVAVDVDWVEWSGWTTESLEAYFLGLAQAVAGAMGLEDQHSVQDSERELESS